MMHGQQNFKFHCYWCKNYRIVGIFLRFPLMKADLWALKLYVTYIQNFLGLTIATGFSIIPTFRRPKLSPSS